jgi:hypothetical protein
VRIIWTAFTIVLLLLQTSSWASDATFTTPSAAAVAAASQQTLSQDALFARCYAHLTRQQVSKTHALRLQVRAGSLTAINACLSLLSNSMFQTGGPNKGKITVDTAETRAIIETMNLFHQSWFPSVDFVAGVPVGECWSDENKKLYDFNEPALHVTRALFDSTSVYKDIVIGTTSMSSIRTNGSNPKNTYTNTDAATFPSVPLMAPETGALLGVKLFTDSERATPLKINAGGVVNTSSGTDAFAHYGAGILGTQTFLQLNSGRAMNETMNGGVHMHRRWAKAVYADLLCRDVPVIRLSDAKLSVQTGSAVTTNTPPFRQGQSCMQCHASMDPMAATVRDLAYSAFGRAGGECAASFSTMFKKGSATQPRESGFVDVDPNFYQRPTYGKLYFRSYDGTLINKEVASLTDLGTALAATNDLYVCAASRYFRYFTGISVNLQDIGDTSLPELSADELYYRNLVISLGIHLKTSQRLDQLVGEIMSSPIYQKSSMRQLSQ